MKILIYGLNSSNNLDFSAWMRSSFDCVPVRSFSMFSFDIFEKSELFKIAGPVEQISK